jgi:hypothetical protein
MSFGSFSQEVVNEFLAKRMNLIWDNFTGGGNKPPTTPNPTSAPEEKEQRSEAMGIIWSNKLSVTTRQKYIELWSDPEFARFRDKAEAGLDKLLQAMKDGIFVDHMTKITEEYLSPDGKKVLKKVIELNKPTPKKGWEPEMMFIECLKNAAKDTKILKVFLEMITKQQIFERLDAGELGDIIKQAGQKISGFAKALAWIYIIVLVLLLIVGIVSIITFIVSPGPIAMILAVISTVSILALFGLPSTVGQKLIPGGK